MASAKQLNPNELAGKAGQVLAAGRLFEAERLLHQALAAARQAGDFVSAGDIAMRLLQARKQRIARALQVGKLTIIDAPFGDDVKVKPGCYLVQPPLVASDARRLRLAAFAADVPVLVLCREPLTQMKLVPVVAIGPGITLRTKVRPPQNHAKPDMGWFVFAVEQLGDWAIDTIDPELDLDRKVDVLLDSLEALPEHENLHVALQKSCTECAVVGSARATEPAKSRART